MVKGSVLFVLAVATVVGAALVVSAADQPRPAIEAKNFHTLQGMVVDLQRYLEYRQDGKNPTDAARMASEAIRPGEKRDTNVDIGGEKGLHVEVGKPSEPAPMAIKGFLVSEKSWLSKLTPGAELYVLTCEGAVAPRFDFDKYMGTNIKLSGKTFDHDGVRTICVEKVEPGETPAPPK